MKLLVLCCTAAVLAAAPSASADVFWANKYDDAIGHSDGGAPNQSFITGASHPVGLAADARHVYWTNYEGVESIGRANLDGTGVDQACIGGATNPVGLALDAAHVYWTNSTAGTIGRADLDGAHATQAFLTVGGAPYGLAVDGSHIYWSDIATDEIGRADLDGGNPDPSFMSGPADPNALAVDAAHIYWTDGDSNKIGRADLDGGNPNPAFIGAAADPWGVAVDGTHVYWTDQGPPKTVGRADLDGGNPNDSLFPASAFGIYGVAVSPPAAATTSAGCVKAGPAKRSAPTPPGALAPPSRADRSSPALSHVGLSRAVFVAASHGASIAGSPVGTRLRYRLSEAATVRFRIARRKAGRIVRGGCRKRSRRNRRRRKCDRALKGGFSLSGAVGRNQARFNGRLRGRKLRPGRYVLLARATDRAGNTSKPARVRFRIRRR